MLGGYSTEKSYQDVDDAFDKHGFKEKKGLLHSNGGKYYFELNGEGYNMLFEYDDKTNKAAVNKVPYPTEKELDVEIYKNTKLSDNKNFKYENIDAKVKNSLLYH